MTNQQHTLNIGNFFNHEYEDLIEKFEPADTRERLVMLYLQEYIEKNLIKVKSFDYEFDSIKEQMHKEIEDIINRKVVNIELRDWFNEDEVLTSVRYRGGDIVTYEGEEILEWDENNKSETKNISTRPLDIATILITDHNVDSYKDLCSNSRFLDYVRKPLKKKITTEESTNSVFYKDNLIEDMTIEDYNKAEDTYPYKYMVEFPKFFDIYNLLDEDETELRPVIKRYMQEKYGVEDTDSPIAEVFVAATMDILRKRDYHDHLLSKTYKAERIRCEEYLRYILGDKIKYHESSFKVVRDADAFGERYSNILFVADRPVEGENLEISEGTVVYKGNEYKFIEVISDIDSDYEMSQKINTDYTGTLDDVWEKVNDIKEHILKRNITNKGADIYIGNELVEGVEYEEKDYRTLQEFIKSILTC